MKSEKKKAGQPSRWGVSLKDFPWKKDTQGSHREGKTRMTRREDMTRSMRRRTAARSDSSVASFRRNARTATATASSEPERKRAESGGTDAADARRGSIRSPEPYSKRIPMSKWIGDLKHLMEFHSVTSSARDNRNARGTGFHWIGKVSAVLDGIQDDVVLKGRVYLDEAFFKAARSDVRKKDGKELRGISRDTYSVSGISMGTRYPIRNCTISDRIRRKRLTEC